MNPPYECEQKLAIPPKDDDCLAEGALSSTPSVDFSRTGAMLLEWLRFRLEVLKPGFEPKTEDIFSYIDNREEYAEIDAHNIEIIKSLVALSRSRLDLLLKQHKDKAHFLVKDNVTEARELSKNCAELLNQWDEKAVEPVCGMNAVSIETDESVNVCISEQKIVEETAVAESKISRKPEVQSIFEFFNQSHAITTGDVTCNDNENGNDSILDSIQYDICEIEKTEGSAIAAHLALPSDIVRKKLTDAKDREDIEKIYVEYAIDGVHPRIEFLMKYTGVLRDTSEEEKPEEKLKGLEELVLSHLWEGLSS